LTLFDVTFFTGNGRPFAMEVCNPGVLFPTQDMLNSVCEYINSGQGINGAKDVELALLKAVSLCVVACNVMRCDAVRCDRASLVSSKNFSCSMPMFNAAVLTIVMTRLVCHNNSVGGCHGMEHDADEGGGEAKGLCVCGVGGEASDAGHVAAH
jgi:hypothetical protein